MPSKFVPEDLKKEFEKTIVGKQHADVGIAMQLLSLFYSVEDSVLVKFQKKAKEELSRQAANIMRTLTHPFAIRLLRKKSDE